MKTKQAGALLLAITFALMVSILGGGLCIVIVNHSGSINSEIERTKAFYRAQAGMEYAIWYAYTNPGWLPATLNVSKTVPGTTNVTITRIDPTQSPFVPYRIQVTEPY